MAPRVVSVVNMKGGVGKSTTVASLAEALSADGLRVLVIDLDPQSNVSMMLSGQDRWIDLLPWTRSDAVRPGEAPNELTVRAVGPQLTFLVNGVLLALRDTQGNLVGFGKVMRDRTDVRGQIEALGGD